MTAQEILLFIVKLLAGTGVFLTGVHLLTSNIEQLATFKIRNLFNKTADKKLLNVGIGAATTAIIQSSGVTTVLIVGFVNVGIMNLHQATAMIMGANIGTTVTAQISALSAFPITTYLQIAVFIGMMTAMVVKNDNIKRTAMIVAGLGLVFIGLDIMSDSMSVNKEAIQTVFEIVQNPFLLFFIGIILTALVQSSSATTSIIIAICVAGLQIGTGGNEVLYIILGTNIGSCVTALMSSIGATANAKRASLIHLMFNVFGSIIFFTVLMLWPTFMDQTFKVWFTQPATQIAMFHTFFNIVCTALFLPFTGVFVKLSTLIIRDKQKTQTVTYMDERLISTPSLAINQLEKEIMLLSDSAMDVFRKAYKAFYDKDTAKIEEIQDDIEKTNVYSQEIVNFIIKVSAHCKSLAEENHITDIHKNIGDIMRIAEIADNFAKYTAKEVKHNLAFSDSVKEQLNYMVEKIESMYSLTKRALLENNLALLDQIDKTEEEIDCLRKTLIDNHIDRLNKGECHPENSSIFINLVSNLERLGDHLTYIAYTVKK